mmetsp:Transcript_17123/g.22234  ORF Transcript_17123/g.22234 Transcript_17123/m.22234 type:complete len:111 (-) Transcript_17123:171-503(-)
MLQNLCAVEEFLFTQLVPYYHQKTKTLPMHLRSYQTSRKIGKDGNLMNRNGPAWEGQVEAKTTASFCQTIFTSVTDFSLPDGVNALNNVCCDNVSPLYEPHFTPFGWKWA